jgi:hypothetical protein
MMKKKGALANEKLQQMVADQNGAEHRKKEAKRMEVKVLSKPDNAVIAIVDNRPLQQQQQQQIGNSGGQQLVVALIVVVVVATFCSRLVVLVLVIGGGGQLVAAAVKAMKQRAGGVTVNVDCHEALLSKPLSLANDDLVG